MPPGPYAILTPSLHRDLRRGAAIDFEANKVPDSWSVEPHHQIKPAQSAPRPCCASTCATCPPRWVPATLSTLHALSIGTAHPR